ILGPLLTIPMLGASAQTGTPTSAEQQLDFDVQFRDTVLAASQSGFSLGDRFILNDLLLSEGQVVGHDGGVCTIVDTAGEAVCSVVFALPDGTIAAEFLNTPPPEKMFAIT